MSSFINRLIYFSIKEPHAARSLVNHLVQKSSDSIILPYADNGPISKEILSRDFRSLTVCEPDTDLRHDFISSVIPKYPNKNVFVHADDIFDLSYKTHNSIAQERCAEIVKETGDSSGGCDRAVKLLVPLLKSKYESGFLRSLYYQVTLRLGLFANTWVHHYLLMSDRQHAYLMAQPCKSMRLYRSSTVLCNTIFNIRTLESYDLAGCFGINVRKIQNTAAKKNASYQRVHLVWLEPRIDVISSSDARSFIEFRFLVTQMMHKRTCLVFDFLDKFFDDHRDDLSKFNIDADTRSGDLSKEQYYDLFLYLKNRHDYQNSTFLQAAVKAEESFLL